MLGISYYKWVGIRIAGCQILGMFRKSLFFFRAKRLFISWDEIKYDLYGDKSNIHTFCDQKDLLKAKYECRPSETLTAKDQMPLQSTTGNELFLLRIFFPPQDFLIPIKHLGSAIQLTEEVSVVHSTFFSFPTQNNYVRKKGDPAIWQLQIAQATGVYPLWLVPAILDETGEDDPMFVDLGVYGWCQR